MRSAPHQPAAPEVGAAPRSAARLAAFRRQAYRAACLRYAALAAARKCRRCGGFRVEYVRFFGPIPCPVCAGRGNAS